MVYNEGASTNSARFIEMEVNGMNYGEKMKQLRGNKSRRNVAEELGISLSAYTKYERCERVPSDKMKIVIAGYFKKTVQEIFFDQNEHK